MQLSSFTLMVALAFGATAQGAEKSANFSQEASLKIQGVRLGRPTPTLTGDSANYYYGENVQGVALQLLLTLKKGTFLSTKRDALQIETFIDDTYQSLLGAGYGTTSYGEQVPMVTEDGSSLVFNVYAARSPAKDATRVFVRGKMEARVVSGEEKVETARLPLIVGQGITVGPFGTILRSMNDNGETGVALTLALHDNSGRIRKVRVLDAEGNGKMLSDPKQTRFTYNQSLGNASNPTMLYATLQRPATNAVTIEFTYAEASEQISIPFEAQVDLGVAKAGPVTAVDPSNKGQSEASKRVWPPPPVDKSKPLPARRSEFTPETKPGQTGNNK